jgi:hypothetical protein
MEDDGDVLVTKFIGNFKHNYADTLEMFTDGRQNDVDLSDVSLTWHMKVLKDFDFELNEYFNGDEDNMESARKFRVTFDENFEHLQLETTLFDPELTYTVYYTATDEIVPSRKSLIPIKEDTSEVSETEEV